MIETTFRTITLVGGPLILICGSLCNILTIVVLRRSAMRNMRASFYLTALTVSDLGVVCFGTPRWMSLGLGEDLRTTSYVVCKIHTFCMTFCMYSSAWILVLVTIQRVLCVFYPLKAKSLITPRSCVLQLGATLITLFGACLNFFWTLEIKTLAPHKEKECGQVDADVELIWGLVDVALGSILPFTALLVCNSMIIVKMYRSKQKMHKDKVGNDRKRVSRLSLVLVMVSGVFLLCTLPSVVTNHVLNLTNQSQTMSLLKYKHMLLANHVVSWFILLNSSVNFLLYCMMGPVFRQELVAMCYLCCSKNPDKMATRRRQTTFGPANHVTFRTGHQPPLKNNNSVRDLDIKPGSPYTIRSKEMPLERFGNNIAIGCDHVTASPVDDRVFANANKSAIVVASPAVVAISAMVAIPAVVGHRGLVAESVACSRKVSFGTNSYADGNIYHPSGCPRLVPQSSI